jgi:hypothetical protein
MNARRVLRGGSWINNGRNARSAYHNANDPGNRNDNIGFRLAPARTTVDAPFDQTALRSAGPDRRRKAKALRRVSRLGIESPPERRPRLAVTFPLH